MTDWLGATFLLASFAALRRAAAERVVAVCCLAAGLAVPIAYAIAAWVQVNTVRISHEPVEVVKLAGICLALFTPFLLVGIALSTIFGGFAFGWVAYRTKSFLYPFLIHWFIGTYIIIVAAGGGG